MLAQVKVFRDEDGVWCASGIEHGIHTQGQTLDELFANIEEATQLHFEEELAAGKTIDLLILSEKEFAGAEAARRSPAFLMNRSEPRPPALHDAQRRQG